MRGLKTTGAGTEMITRLSGVRKRPARLRKERDDMQTELRGKIGVAQTLVTDYENFRIERVLDRKEAYR